MSDAPTLEQKKAVIRVLGDLLRHNKVQVSDSDYSYFVYLGVKVLQLKEEDMMDAQSNRFSFNWLSLINDLSPLYQLAFKQLMIALLTHDGRYASALEKEDFVKYLSVLFNPSGLSLSFDSVKQQVQNELQRLYQNSNRLLPWI